MRHIFFFLLLTLSLNAQDDLPFYDEVKQIQEQVNSTWNSTKSTIVFTGSSSVRLWKDLQERFPDKQILNTGFGGSQSSDLELYLDELILNYNPEQVFIYEGDNDISNKKRPRAIKGTIHDIIEELLRKKPQMEIVLISAKPSIARWHLKRKYMRLNKRLHKLASEIKNVRYADVWSAMTNKRKLKTHLFISDGLHMNHQGYELWYNVLKDYVN
ncbi:GDSL-type esterase/lipase family protein [Flagellimonas sp. S3867]|uniref:GDSL-type esterase/lipase family protein n=1 Tax=Flagellimonas sp. S3867 TaxID=2768063 RepID=UPI00168804B5|nr:GDSL-type esterase/lipase family protein [Flagellimonas sp. S3867]